MPVPSACEEALLELAANKGDLRRCIRTLTPMLFALAHRLHLPQEIQEAAVGDALRDIQEHGVRWSRTQLPAQVWVLAIARRRFLSNYAA